MRAFAAFLGVFVLATCATFAQNLSQIEQIERQRWFAEDRYMQEQYRLRRGTPPSDISQRTPEQTRLVEEMMRLRKRRVSEVAAALLRYCPTGEPPCSPEPPRYLLEQARAIGLIEPSASTTQPHTECFGLIDPDGPMSMDCYERR
jgi:hypothetical protein